MFPRWCFWIPTLRQCLTPCWKGAAWSSGFTSREGGAPKRGVEHVTDEEVERMTALRQEGMTFTQVAKALGISAYTVKAHVRTLLQKTGCSSRTDLAIHARVGGIALDPASKA